ncbi:hypothetical protein GDO81_009970 [Engystomops pustulosus]|uniref:Coatomer subunit gamma-2 n=1 Tax=Engystomops pustulosus TaxID=76066 RepID=A0AAV7BWT1_ENGPU|nr:hypothetical protein GDO81_009970 [Engystomops pustulosus]
MIHAFAHSGDVSFFLGRGILVKAVRMRSAEPCVALQPIPGTRRTAPEMIKKFDKKDEEAGSGSNPFQHLEKSAVLQEARLFNETPINPRRCLHILTKILYLLNQGEHFGTMEATEAFFAMTRLFQSNDQTLRRMCYLTIKEMANISEDVIIVTSR